MSGSYYFSALFFHPMGKSFGGGVSRRLAKEIGIWNVGVPCGDSHCCQSNMIGSIFERVPLALIIGGFGIGTNHLFAYLNYHLPVNVIELLEIIFLFWVGLFGWKYHLGLIIKILTVCFFDKVCRKGYNIVVASERNCNSWKIGRNIWKQWKSSQLHGKKDVRIEEAEVPKVEPHQQVKVAVKFTI